jgi:hypothetical protein
VTRRIKASADLPPIARAIFAQQFQRSARREIVVHGCLLRPTTNMKTQHLFLLSAIAFAASLSAPAFAGDYPDAKQIIEPPVPSNPWADTRRPITNPVHFDLAIPQTVIHPLFIHNRMPNQIDTILGRVPVGGDYQLYALQLEVALTERLSLNATKDGYIDFNPDFTLTPDEGFANVGAGLKYAWLLDPANGLASNFQVLYEAPLGNDDVWQGYGDGIITPSVNVTKLWGPLQFVDQIGWKIPVDSSESSVAYNSTHLSYAVTDWLFPLVEVNWFHVIDEGDGSPRYLNQAGGAVPAIANFEGGDLVNLGAINAGTNEDLVTLAAGFRLRCTDNIDLGFAFEFPLTEDDASLMEDRLTVDLTIRF